MKVVSEVGWARLRRELMRLPQKQLVDILKGLHDLARPNREFLHARLNGGGSSLESYRQRVIDAVAPDPFGSRPVRMGEAQSAVREYTRATSDAQGTVDLLLSLLEAGTEHAVDLGYYEERYLDSLLGTAKRTIAKLPDLAEDARSDAHRRLRAIARRAADTGYGFGDGLVDLVNDLGVKGSGA